MVQESQIKVPDHIDGIYILDRGMLLFGKI